MNIKADERPPHKERIMTVLMLSTAFHNTIIMPVVTHNHPSGNVPVWMIVVIISVVVVIGLGIAAVLFLPRILTNSELNKWDRNRKKQWKAESKLAKK